MTFYKKTRYTGDLESFHASVREACTHILSTMSDRNYRQLCSDRASVDVFVVKEKISSTRIMQKIANIIDDHTLNQQRSKQSRRKILQAARTATYDLLEAADYALYRTTGDSIAVPYSEWREWMSRQPHDHTEQR